MKKSGTGASASVPLRKHGPPSRIPKLESLLRSELNTIIKRELEFPLGTLVTVSQVTIDAELAHAKVGISILPFDSGTAVFASIERAAGHLQRVLNSRLKVYRVPHLDFFWDTDPERVGRLEHLLDSIKEEG